MPNFVNVYKDRRRCGGHKYNGRIVNFFRNRDGEVEVAEFSGPYSIELTPTDVITMQENRKKEIEALEAEMEAL